MIGLHADGFMPKHSHAFLGTGHDKHERRTWAVIALCSAMMLLEIGGGLVFGSLALVADGLHMSTHAAALLIAACAYTYARRHAEDRRFAFGTGKLGDLAGFGSAIILAMIALLIGFEAVTRLIHPVAIDFNQAIPIALLGLLVNLASAWLLGGDHGHSHGHHGHAHDESRRLDTVLGALRLEIFEEDVPPCFRVYLTGATWPDDAAATVETTRSDGTRQVFGLIDRGDYRESDRTIPEPHDFTVRLKIVRGGQVSTYDTVFAEHHHGHGTTHRDNNMRAAFVHVLADAAVSVLAVLGLSLGKVLGWGFMDPVMGLVGMVVIANWAYGLLRDTGAILLDMTADRGLADRIRAAVETDGDRLTDLHLWRLGPGHLGAIVSVASGRQLGTAFYRQLLAHFPTLSHLTIEVEEP